MKRDHSVLVGNMKYMRACEVGNMPALEKMNEKVVATMKEEGGTCFVSAAANGHSAAVKLLLQKGLLIHSHDTCGNTALMAACKKPGKQQCETVQLLLTSGIDVNAVNNDSTTALMIAAKEGHAEHVIALVDREANIDAVDKVGDSAVMMACSAGNREIIDILIKRGNADMNIANKLGATAVTLAYTKGNTSVVCDLLKQGVTMEQGTSMDKSGSTPLMLACINGDEDIASLLLAHETDLEMTNKGDLTALMIACKKGRNLPVALMLAKDPAPLLNKVDKEGFTALMHACRGGHEIIVGKLIEAKANLEIEDKFGNTALMLACNGGFGGIVDRLLEAGANAFDGECVVGTEVCWLYENYTIVHDAGNGMFTLSNDATINRHHFKAAAPPAVDIRGNSCLLLACFNGHLKVVQLLLKREEIHISYANQEGDTALHIAAEQGHSDIAMCLMENGAKLDALNLESISCFAYAVQHASAAVCRKMLEIRPDVYSTRILNELPIELAMRVHYNSDSDQLDIVTQLLLRDMPISIKGEHPEEISHMFSWSMFLESRMNAKTKADLLEKLFTQHNYKIVARELSYMCDMRGRVNINIADQSMVYRLGKYIFFCGRYDISKTKPLHLSDTAVVVHAEDYGLLEGYVEAFATYAVGGSLDKDQFCECVANLDEGNKFTKETYEKHFVTYGEDQNALKEDKFFEYCRNMLGVSRGVVIKFMSNKGQYLRHKEVVKSGEWTRKHVVNHHEGPSMEEFSNAVETYKLEDGSGDTGERDMSKYKYGLVMPAADRNLDSIFRQERPDMLSVSILAKQLVECVQHVHEKGIVHGDLKLLNSVRIANRLCLIDFDASGVVNENYAGSKFSSGILPPEMFYRLKDKDELNQYNEYFADIKDNEELWSVVEPKLFQDSYYVVKTYDVMSDGISPRDMEKLPFELVKLTLAFDMWSLGVMLYVLCSGKSLFRVNRDDDLIDGESMKIIMEWKDSDVEEEIYRYVTDDCAIDLLTKLLKVDPTARPETLKDVLKHPFFTESADRKSQSKRLQYFQFRESGHKMEERIRAIRDSPLNVENMTHMDKERGEYFLKACKSGNLAKVNAYLERGKKICMTKDGMTALMNAGRHGHYRITECLLEHGAEVDCMNTEGYTALKFACAEGRIRIVQLLLDHGEKVFECDRVGKTALELASENGHVNIVDLLLKLGLNVDTVDMDGRTAFLSACSHGHVDVVERLVDAKAKVAAVDKKGNTAMMLACGGGHANVVELLLKKQVDLIATDKKDNTPLMMAALGGYLDVVNILLSNAADLEAVNSEGDTALTLSASMGHADVVDVLLKHGANAQAKNERDMTPMLCACVGGHEKVVILLLDVSVELVGAVDKTGSTALMMACEYGHVDVVTLLWQKQASSEQVTTFGHGALLCACRGGHVSVVEYLFNEGVEMEHADDESGVTPLRLASEFGHGDVVTFLLEQRVDVMVKDKDNNSALTYACMGKHGNVVKIFLENAVDIDLMHEEVLTSLKAASSSALQKFADAAMLYACRHDHVNILNYLIDMKVDDESNEHDRAEDGNAPLMIACMAGHAATAALLLKRSKKNVNGRRKKDENTVLMLACRKDNPEVVSLLLNNNADVTAVNKDNSTALMEACEVGHFDIVKLLLQTNKINVNATDKNGNTAMLLGCISGHLRVVDLLLKIDGVDLNVVNQKGDTALHLACSKKQDNVAIDLLNKKARMDILNKDGKNCLCLAVMYSNVDVVKKMLAIDENLMFVRCGKELPIQHAANIFGNPDQNAIVEELLIRDMPYDISGPVPLERSHSYSWSFFLISKMSAESEISVVDYLFKDHNYRKVARELAYMTDRRGRVNINIADEAMQYHLGSYIYFCGRYDIAKGPALHCSDNAVVVRAEDHGVLNAYLNAFDNFEKQDLDHLDQEEFCSCVEQLDIDDKYSKDVYVEQFIAWDGNKDNTICREEFMKFCKANLGLSRSVVIKFMSHKGQYLRESNCRKQWDRKFVVPQFEGPSMEEFSNAVETYKLEDGSGDTGERDMSKYKYGLVMPAADRNLDSIFRQERPDMLSVSILAKQLVECVQHVHEKGIVHGDLKLLNSVRIANRLCLIDFDASGVVNENYAGSKFSSGILPPEMFYRLKDKDELNQYNEYFADIKNNVGSKSGAALLWAKVKPKLHLSCYYVVKTFDIVNNGGDEFGPRNVDLLPYKVVKLSKTTDMWSFGVLLFTLCAGKSLFRVNRDDDLTEGESMKTIMEWKDSDVEKEIMRYVTDENAIDILTKLLKVDANERPENMEEVLDHPFFNASADRKSDEALAILKSVNEKMLGVENMLREIKNLSLVTTNQIQVTQKVLLKGIFEATEVSIPSCFIISPKELDYEGEEEEETSLEAVTAKLETVNGYFDFLDNFAVNVGNAIVEKVNEKFDDFASKKLYFYLVDEITMQPIVPPPGGVYPIVIDTKSKFIEDMMPLIKVGFQAIRLVNGLAGIAKCLGYPVPYIPAENMGSAENFIGALDKDSSVADSHNLSSNVEDALGENGAGTQNVRGEALRELKNLYKKEDPESTFAGLKRMYTADGAAFWSTEESIEMAENEVKEKELAYPVDDPGPGKGSSSSSYAVNAPRKPSNPLPPTRKSTPRNKDVTNPLAASSSAADAAVFQANFDEIKAAMKIQTDEMTRQHAAILAAVQMERLGHSVEQQKQAVSSSATAMEEKKKSDKKPAAGFSLFGGYGNSKQVVPCDDE